MAQKNIFKPSSMKARENSAGSMSWSTTPELESLALWKTRGKIPLNSLRNFIADEVYSVDEGRRIMETNLFGPLHLIQTLLPTMREQKSGTIVNVSSAAGFDPRPSMGMYGASKFALEGMSQALAKEVAPFGIRVLIVQPGAFTTNMMNAVQLTEKLLTAAYRDTEVGKWVGMFGGSAGERSFAAPNDVEKGCQAMFEVITGTGRGEGKEKYLRLPLSKDCAVRTMEHAGRLKEGHDAFQDIWESTGHDGGVTKVFTKN